MSFMQLSPGGASPRTSLGTYPAARRLETERGSLRPRCHRPVPLAGGHRSPETASWLAAQQELWGGPAHQPPAARGVHQARRGTSPGRVRVTPGVARHHLLRHPPRSRPGARSALRRWHTAHRPDGHRPDRSYHPRPLAAGQGGPPAGLPTVEGGTEESLLRVIDVGTGALVDGPIDRCRYSGVAWLPGGKAFYYVRRLPPEDVPDGEEQYHRRVYLHTVGTDPGSDALVFGRAGTRPLITRRA